MSPKMRFSEYFQGVIIAAHHAVCGEARSKSLVEQHKMWSLSEKKFTGCTEASEGWSSVTFEPLILVCPPFTSESERLLGNQDTRSKTAQLDIVKALENRIMNNS